MLYAAPLPPAAVELRLPTIGLSPIERAPARAPRIRRLHLRDEADHVLAHRVDFLGSGLVDLGAEIDWHRDFKSGYRWPPRFYQDIEVTRLDDDSDAKVPWELSRCHHLLTLARAARLFEDERYAAELERQLASWLDANPPGIGINWTTPMEVGIRAVNLVWAVATLEEWRPLDPRLRGRLIESLRWHGRHIEANLEGTPYLRSNHYLGDILGLLVLGSVLGGEPAASRWSEFARREFEREIGKQVYADGVSFEASLAYQGLVLEMLLIASYISAWAGTPLSNEFHEQLHRMVDVSRSVRHPNGRIPLFGDQDSGRVLPEGFARPPTHDNLLWLAAALIGETRPLNGPVHPEVAWTFGVDAWRRAAELPAAAAGSVRCVSRRWDLRPTLGPDSRRRPLRRRRTERIRRSFAQRCSVVRALDRRCTADRRLRDVRVHIRRQRSQRISLDARAQHRLHRRRRDPSESILRASSSFDVSLDRPSRHATSPVIH